MRAKGSIALGLLLALALCFCLAPSAQAARSLLTKAALQTNEKSEPRVPPPDGEIDAACGLAFSGATLYVSDYYHGQIYAYAGTGASFSYLSTTPVGIPPEGPCQLATGPSGALYANLWHQSALRIKPTAQTFDIASSTGVATDAAGNLYVNDRTHINVYGPTGTLLQEVGVGHLTDAYGLAVSAGEVFVAEAATNEVVVFEPSLDPIDPKRTITGPSALKPFVSLRDAALAIDPTNGHLLVLDNLQPGFEHPHGAVYEFDEDGSFLFTLPDQVIDALPAGIAVDPESGNLYVTSGDSEGSNAYAWGPASGGGGGGGGAATAPSVPGPASSVATHPAQPVPSSQAGPSAHASEAIQQGNLRVALDAGLAPRRLPREKDAPVRFSISARVSSADGSIPPQLRAITLKLNRNGHVDPTALPVCEMEDVQPSTTQGALAACRSSFVGEGRLLAKVLLAEQSPFPSSGRIVAFNGTWQGHPAILAHVYGTKPVPTSTTIPFVISTIAKGTYATQLKARLPHFSSKWGYITGISLDLGRSSPRQPYVSAACRAPKGFGVVSFPLTQVKLSFESHAPVTQKLTRSCAVR